MGYNGSPEDQINGQKYYNYTKGTDYYLANRYGNLKPITVDITYDGNEFTFTPDYTITESEAGSDTAKITDKSLLSGVTKLMTMITSFCGIRSMFDKKDKKDQQFVIKQDYSKCDVTLYIDYTNNMIFPDDDPDKYKDLEDYLFPNNRYPSYSSGFARIDLPKDLIKVEYSTNLGYIRRDGLLYDKVKLYKKFLEAFKNEKLINILNKLEIKEQIDIPTKLVIYGVCDKFGKYKGYEGICAILYIEHKVTLDDYIKFKSLCDNELNEQLKPLNLTVDYIKELTPEKLRKDFPTFAAIEELTMACSRLGDPRGLRYSKNLDYIKYRYYLYDEDRTYSDDGGLQRWKAIKKYYPELYNGLKIILQYYIELRDKFDKKFQSEYEKKYVEAVDDFSDKILNSEDNVNVLELSSDDAIQIEHMILKYINKYINSLEPIKIDNVSDLFDLFNILNQNILDIISKIYTNYYKQQIRDYKAEHPKARQVTIIFDTSNDILSKGHIDKTTSIFNYEPFIYGLLPKVIQDALNQNNSMILDILNKFKLFYGANPHFLVNNQILDWSNTITGDRKYVINIADGLESFEFAYINDLKHNNNIDDELNKKYKFTSISNILNIDIKYIKDIINIMLSSEFKLKIKWLNKYNDYEQKLSDPTKNYINDDFKDSVYNGKSTPDSVINHLKQNKFGGLNNYIYFRIAFDYKNPEIIADKLKNYNLPDTK